MTHSTFDRSVWPRWSVVFVLALGGAAWLTAPASGQAEPEPDPYEAKVIENTVPVRAGAGRAYYQVGELKRGDFVTVRRDFFGWLEIEAPAGVFCFVDRKNVDARGDGSRGIVNTDFTKFYAAHFKRGPNDSYSLLGELNTGDEVKIIASVDNAYKILPPKRAFVYLPPKTVEPVGEAPAAPVTPEPAQPVTPEPTPPAVVEVPQPPVVVAPVVPEPVAPAQPAEPVAVAVETPEPVAPEPQITPLPDVSEVSFEDPADITPTAAKVDLLNDPDVKVALPDVSITTQASNELLRAVEIAILPYFTLPVDQQPIAKMVRGYADAAQIEGLSDNDLTIVRTRLTELERNRTIAETMQDIEDTNVEVNDGQPPAPLPVAIDDSMGDGNGDAAADAGPEVPAAPVAPPAPVGPTTEYDAVGILTASTVHTGGDQPQLFRLLDPTGRRTVAYLEPGGQIDTVQMIGRLVGIVGDSVYDPSTKLNLIQPTRVDILNAR